MKNELKELQFLRQLSSCIVFMADICETRVKELNKEIRGVSCSTCKHNTGEVVCNRGNETKTACSPFFANWEANDTQCESKGGENHDK